MRVDRGLRFTYPRNSLRLFAWRLTYPRNSLRLFAWRLTLALSLVATLFATNASAYCRLTTSQAVAGYTCVTTGKPLAWPRQCISYSVVARAASSPSLVDIRDAVDRSFAAWLEVSCSGSPVALELQQTEALSTCDVPTYDEKKPNANSIMFVGDWKERELPPEAFGLTLVWHDPNTGEILDADMQLNETLGPLTICEDAHCAAGEVDIENIVTHEAGHFLGLGHSSEVDACMYGKAEVGETSKRFLSHDDEAGLCAIYGALAAPSCQPGSFEPNNGFGNTCNPLPEPSSGSGDNPFKDAPSACNVVAADGGSALNVLVIAGVLAWSRRVRRRRES